MMNCDSGSGSSMRVQRRLPEGFPSIPRRDIRQYRQPNPGGRCNVGANFCTRSAGRTDELFLPFEVAIEPRYGALNGIHLILALRKTVPLVWIVVGGNDCAGLFQDIDDLHGFLFRNTDIIVALEDKQRRPGFPDERDWRVIFIDLAVSDRISNQERSVLLKVCVPRAGAS